MVVLTGRISMLTCLVKMHVDKLQKGQLILCLFGQLPVLSEMIQERGNARQLTKVGSREEASEQHVQSQHVGQCAHDCFLFGYRQMGKVTKENESRQVTNEVTCREPPCI